MNRIKSQQGMVIFFILLFITLFSIIGLTIVSMSVSNAKQTSNIERDMQSVDVAEMGIIHYRNELVVKMNDVLTKDIKNAIAKIEEQNNIVAQQNGVKVYTEINKENVLLKMQELKAFDDSKKFSLGYAPNQLHAVQGSPNFTYTFEEMPIDKSRADFPEKIVIKVKSIGYAKNDQNEVDAEFTFSIGDIISTNLKPGTLPSPVTSNLIDKPVLELMQNGDKLAIKTCQQIGLKSNCESNNSSPHINKVEAGIQGPVNININEFVMKDSKLYVHSGEFKTGTIKELSNSKIHSNGNIVFNHSNGNGGFWNNEISSNGKITFSEMLVFDQNKVYAKGDITLGNLNSVNSSIGKKGGLYKSLLYSESGKITIGAINQPMIDSYIYSYGKLTLGNMNSSGNIINTKIYTKGDLAFSSMDGEIKTNSVVLVEGNITVQNANGNVVDTSSFLCAKGSIDKKILDKARDVNGPNGKVVKNIQEKVKSFDTCGMPSTSASQSTPSTLDAIMPSLSDAINEASYKYK